MKLLLFLQPMSSLPLWGTGTAQPQDEKVRVGAADNSSAGLEFCRVAVQVIVSLEGSLMLVAARAVPVPLGQALLA